MKATEIKEMAKELVQDYFSMSIEDWKDKWFRAQRLTDADGELMGYLADVFITYKQDGYTKEQAQSLCDGYMANYENGGKYD